MDWIYKVIPKLRWWRIEKNASHIGDLLMKIKEMGVRLGISSGLLGKDFSPEHLRCWNTSGQNTASLQSSISNQYWGIRCWHWLSLHMEYLKICLIIHKGFYLNYKDQLPCGYGEIRRGASENKKNYIEACYSPYLTYFSSSWF